MMDFSDAFVGRWRDGSPGYISVILATVTSRGQHTAYLIDRGDCDEFQQWVADVRHEEGAFRATDEDDEPNETVEEHLNRIGCAISYHDLIL